MVGNYALSIYGVGYTVKNNHIHDGENGAIQFFVSGIMSLFFSIALYFQWLTSCIDVC